MKNRKQVTKALGNIAHAIAGVRLLSLFLVCVKPLCLPYSGCDVDSVFFYNLFLLWPCHSYKSWQTHLRVILAIRVQGSTAHRLQAPMFAPMHATGHIDHGRRIWLIEPVLVIDEIHDTCHDFNACACAL